MTVSGEIYLLKHAFGGNSFAIEAKQSVNETYV